MSEQRKSIIPGIEELDAEIQYHKDQLAILKAHRRTTAKLIEKGYQSLAVKAEPEPDGEHAS